VRKGGGGKEGWKWERGGYGRRRVRGGGREEGEELQAGFYLIVSIALENAIPRIASR